MKTLFLSLLFACGFACAQGVPLLLPAQAAGSAAARLEVVKKQQGVGPIRGIYKVNPGAMNAKIISFEGRSYVGERDALTGMWSGKNGDDSLHVSQAETTYLVTIDIDRARYSMRPLGGGLIALYKREAVYYPDKVTPEMIEEHDRAYPPAKPGKGMP